MSFIAPGAEPVEETAIANNGFFPDIEPEECRASMRLDGTVTPTRLRDALIEAIQSVNSDLAAWEAAQTAAGYSTLAAVPAQQVGGKSVQLHRYLRAVNCLAQANLAERYRDFDSTGAGHREADKLEMPIDDIRRDARWAIRDILGVRRTTVELI